MTSGVLIVAWAATGLAAYAFARSAPRLSVVCFAAMIVLFLADLIYSSRPADVIASFVLGALVTDRAAEIHKAWTETKR